MSKRFLGYLLAAVLVFSALASASTLFYAGDFDPNNPNANGLANENDGIVGGNPYGAATFQNFIVPNGQNWTVTGLFSNDLMNIAPGQAYWEIRTGVSEGNGGTLIASGTGTDIVTATGRSGFGFTEFNNLVTGLNLHLGPGMYWMTVVPLAPGQFGRSFNSNTFGLNSIGSDVQNQEFFNSSFFGANYTNANNEGVFPLFSDGVIGTTGGGTVPEPASLVLFGSSFLGLAGVIRRKLAK
jgi:PEP-CTERM motif-containing protein